MPSEPIVVGALPNAGPVTPLNFLDDPSAEPLYPNAPAVEIEPADRDLPPSYDQVVKRK